MRDKLAKHVSQSCKVHIPVEELEALAEPKEVTEDRQDAEMVTRQKMTVDRFLPGTRPSAQSQQPQGKGCTPPSPSASHSKKK